MLSFLLYPNTDWWIQVSGIMVAERSSLAWQVEPRHWGEASIDEDRLNDIVIWPKMEFGVELIMVRGMELATKSDILM